MPNFSRRNALAAMLAAGSAAFARRASAAGTFARLSFLLVNDFYRISPNREGRGGFARLAAAVKAERARAEGEGRRLFCVHAGDTLSPSLMSGLDQGAHMIDLFNQIGLDAFVPGNHEFDHGKAVYLQRVGEAQFPFLASNMRDSDGGKLPAHEDCRIIEADGLKLALIGLAYDLTPITSHPGDIVFRPTAAILREAAAAARAAGADFVVAIIHSDKATGAALMNEHVADLILSGHNHDLHIDYDGRTVLLESQQDANYIGLVDIDVAIDPGEGGRPSISWRPAFRVIDTSKIAPDEDMQARVAIYEARLAKAFDVEIATLKAPLDSRTGTVRSQEAAIGNLIADAIRAATGAELVIINGGGIRGDRIYSKGARVLKSDILNELPFGNKTVVTLIPGRNIRAALENGLSQLGRPGGRFPQVSGVRFSADTSASAGSRVRSVAINGQDLDESRLYRVGTNDFMALGGDGYTMLISETPASADTGNRLVAQDVMDYVETLTVVDAVVEGRIVLR